MTFCWLWIRVTVQFCSFWTSVQLLRPLIMLYSLKQLSNCIGTVLNWFKSYIFDRTFSVEVGNFSSSSIPLTCGGRTSGVYFGPAVVFALFASFILIFSKAQHSLPFLRRWHPGVPPFEKCGKLLYTLCVELSWGGKMLAGN